MDEPRILGLVSILLKDRERVRWPKEFLSAAHEVVYEEENLSPLQELAAILEICAAYDVSEDLVRTINWVRRASGPN